MTRMAAGEDKKPPIQRLYNDATVSMLCYSCNSCSSALLHFVRAPYQQHSTPPVH